MPAAPFYDVVIARGSPFSAVPEPDLTFEQQEALVRGAWRPEEPLVFRRNSSRRTPDDLFHGGWADVYLASARVLDALRGAGATGWTTYEVRLVDEDGTPLGDHAGLAVTGRCGPIDPALSVPTPGNEYTMTGKLFAEGTWDGSDVFFPDEGGGLFVTERARTALARIPGLLFEPLTSAEWAKGTF